MTPTGPKTPRSAASIISSCVPAGATDLLDRSHLPDMPSNDDAPNTGERPDPDDIGETTQGHPEDEDMDIIDKPDPDAGKEPYPDNIEETTQGHPDEDDMDIIDEPDPNAGKEPYPGDVEPTDDGE